MGNNEDVKSSKSDKSSSPAPPDQGNIRVYPDWAAMQAYYGPRVAIPPYYNSTVASGHPPHPYMWGPPQPMMPPYGAPYAAIYSPGGVYAHPAVPLTSHPHGQGVPPSPAAVLPLSTEAPTKSSGNSERGLMKKLKGFDGLAMSIGNGNAESADDGAEHRLSQSEAEGSTDGSDGNTSKEDQSGRKRSRDGMPIIGGDGKTETQPNPVPGGDVNAAPNVVLGTTVAAAGVPGKPGGPVLSPGMTTLELKNPTSMNAKTSPTSVPQQCAVLPTEGWLQNERELKRERRKQSNRESARRSRLRKQVRLRVMRVLIDFYSKRSAEAEELARKVDSLNVENMTLKSEMNQLTETSEKLRLENATLMEKLKNAHAQEVILNNIDEKKVTPISTENLLSRVNNSGSVDRNVGEEGHLFEKNSNSGAKLHQLLDTSPRADAVAAG
ncbi:hypothetical protein Pint_00531 [Pistacia integerrima]|uniref:Uncharacterized protein n=1 Tax=Pistacia integerrima TaxID=434235 RepID=A0ACC0ZMI2_9ROSI|nr:hypothetical protein Pint_00531 [Pistacia integerrima]